MHMHTHTHIQLLYRVSSKARTYNTKLVSKRNTIETYVVSRTGGR